MAPIKTLFALNIGTTGKITCTEPSPEIYLLTFALPPDNRLTPSFCNTFYLALDIIAHRYPRGVVITTSGISKFYSNGLDYESAVKSKDFFPDVLYPLWKRLLTYEFTLIGKTGENCFGDIIAKLLINLSTIDILCPRWLLSTDMRLPVDS